MTELVPGQRVELHEPVVELRLSGARLGDLSRSLGGLLIALDQHKRIAPDFAPIDIETRELRPGAGYGPNGEICLDLAAVPPQVERLIFVLYLAYGGPAQSLREFERLSLSVGQYTVTMDLAGRDESAVIFAEVYRRGQGWRLCSNGQGFVGGMGALLSALNIDFAIPARAHRDVGPSPGHHDHGRDHRPPPGTSYTGSGFAVDGRHILTNAHVVEGMSKFDVASDQLNAAAELVFVDPRNDIALLRVPDRPLPVACSFRDVFDIHLGEDVIVLGFPLQGLLGSGPQATTGNVSALCGIGNDTSVMQFSAPIASGNSGGPILDQSGQVVGLVYSSLNKERLRDGGINAENINFGVKGAVIRAFLATAGIEPRVAPSGPPRGRADIVREARAFIYRIRCEA
ncbi:trypsin-like peptidase domain-containing protein [Sphingosinicella sp. YJ22]|uniref:trypsin-like peptidase domain-containing protein n=1 Tax=Sphingosinicella sp. YJ22 TaxID=1104780 RepID=UPI001409C513|nr:trypsin-like peptidase domain-containing protein [Sphingosinicella sp. YJ22]